MQKLEKILDINEGIDLECKQAGGKDGKGELPSDFWPTYSAMANTQGGKVLLGVKENKGIFSVVGIEKIERVKTDLFNTLNNKDKVSINLIDDSMVYVKCIDEKNIIIIDIPQASTKERPIYLNNNPLKGTYIRLHEGDRKCPEETIKSMLAEQVKDTLDDKIFANFTIDDLNKTSIQIYKSMLAAINPTHVWLELDDFEFIKSLNGWKRDRKTNIEGLTLAGLLMFGKWTSIQDAIPNYFIEYQETDDISSNNRWSDRIIPDGTWSGNLFDFYRKVYRKLTEDLKVPFNLNSGVRTADSPVHEALREALVNALVHSDYNGETSIQIIKKNGLFYFRNPGIMRVPFSTAKLGGESNCRNKYLHQMFLMVGLGERAGSGIPKILSGWKSQHWSEPELIENRELHYTELELKTENLIHPNTLNKLKNICGSKFDSLTGLDILILSEALENQLISHEHIKRKASSNTRTITLALSKLVRIGLLKSDGIQKNKRYFLSSYIPVIPENKEGYELLKNSFIKPPKDYLFQNKEIFDKDGDSTRLKNSFTRKELYPTFRDDGFLQHFISVTMSHIKSDLSAIEIAIKYLNNKQNHLLDTEQKHTLDTEQKHLLDTEQDHLLDTEQEHRLDTEQKHLLDTEQKHLLDTEQKHLLDTEQEHLLDTEQEHLLDTEQEHLLDTEQKHLLDTEQKHLLDTEQEHLLDTEQKHLLDTEQKHLLDTEKDHEVDENGVRKIDVEKIKERLIVTYSKKSMKELEIKKQEVLEYIKNLEELQNNLKKDDGSYKSFFEFITGEMINYDVPNPDKKIETINEAKELEKEIRYAELLELSKDIREGKKRGVKKSRIMQNILILSMRGFLTVKNFSELLGRNPTSLRRDYLSPLVKDDLLTLAYPSTPTHALQGYRTNIFKLNNDLTKYDK